MKYLIGTRGSRLALAQAEYVKKRLHEMFPQHEFAIRVIHTRGDRIQDRPLNQIGGKGIFVREIEEQILSGEVQIGVHSMKDMPAEPAAGLVFTEPWRREDPRDVLILREKHSLSELPQGAVIGTGSIRREIQLRKLRPDIQVVNLRGNVDTRLRKMEEQKLDGIVLAAAGLHRLDMADRITQYLDTEEMIPAPAQGVLALEVREDASDLREMLDSLKDEESAFTALAERKFLQLAGGDCHMPVGAVCEKVESGMYRLRALFGDVQGKDFVPVEVEGSDAALLAEEACRQIHAGKNGAVYLIGAGPGDPGLITVKGLELIRRADCIIYDRLASPALLEEAKPESEKIYVGKENHHHTMKQEDINRLLVQKAGEYKVVVRLKGGDPYVFGRGGEEALALLEEGISFEVVPGVTSAVAGPAYAGIPVTHRGKAGGFHVVTAHNRRDELADIDFEAMARGEDTCIFLMGLGRLEEIAERLMKAGMPAETEAAVVSHATTAEQRTCQGTLSDIAAIVRREQLESPAVIVVGKTVGLRQKLNVWEKQSLPVKKCLIPKVGENTTKLAKLLRSRGMEPEEIQVGKIVYRDLNCTKEECQKADWLVFTSRHGVAGFFRQLMKWGLDVRALAGCRIAAIGEKTGECLRAKGICPDLVPPQANGKSMAEALRKQLTGTETVWYLKAGKTDDSLTEILSDVCQLMELVVYENQEVPFELPQDMASYDRIYFTCASSVERLLGKMNGCFPERWQKEDCIYSMGPVCSKALRNYGITRICEAKKASYEALAQSDRQRGR